MGESPRLAALDVPRHRCFGCGHCCTGHWIEVSTDEAAVVAVQAEALGVGDPVVDGGLRVEAGRCVFLDDDMRCRIHAAFGGEHKPLTCQQYPFVAIDVGTEVRLGIDPGCTSAWRSWRDGPDVTPDRFRPKRRPLADAQRGAEAALVRALAPGGTVAGALHLLCGGRPGGPDLPPGFAGRWVSRLHAVPWDALLADPGTGDGVRTTLAGLARASAGWDPNAPPSWGMLDPEREAWAIETARRMVFLRLASLLPSVQSAALLTLGGAVAAAWTDPRPEAFASTLAGFARAIRWRSLWQALAPDPATLAWLATGRVPSA